MGSSRSPQQVIRSLADIPSGCLQFKQPFKPGHDTGGAGESEGHMATQAKPRKQESLRLQDIVSDLAAAGIVTSDDGLDLIKQLCLEFGMAEFRVEALNPDAVASKELRLCVADLLAAEPPARTLGTLADQLIASGLASDQGDGITAIAYIESRYEDQGMNLPDNASWVTLGDPLVVSQILADIASVEVSDSPVELPISYEVHVLEVGEESAAYPGLEEIAPAVEIAQSDETDTVSPEPLSPEEVQQRRLHLTLKLIPVLERARQTAGEARDLAFGQLSEAVYSTGRSVYASFELSADEIDQILIRRQDREAEPLTIEQLIANPSLVTEAWYHRASVQLVRSELSPEEALADLSWPKFTYLLREMEQRQKRQAARDRKQTQTSSEEHTSTGDPELTAVTDPTPDQGVVSGAGDQLPVFQPDAPFTATGAGVVADGLDPEPGTTPVLPDDSQSSDLSDEPDDSEQIRAYAKQLADAGELSIEEILAAVEEQFI